MTRTLVIANQKGGVGKSTTTVNIGRALVEKNQRVLLIDLDPQGGMSASLGVNSFTIRRSTYSILMSPQSSLARILRPVVQYLALAPASFDLANAEVSLASKADGVTRLRDALKNNRIPFDFILIDTPPTLGILTANGLVAAEEVIIPIQCQYLAMRGVKGLLDTITRMSSTGLNSGLKLRGVIATMYRADFENSREAAEEMQATFGSEIFSTLIAYDDAVAEAPITAQSLLDYAPNHAVSQAYRAIAEEILQS